MGSVSVPGISDLDFILVFDDDMPRIDYKSYYNQLDNRDRYILMHSPFAITKSLFENIRYFYIPKDFKLLWGKELQIKEISYIKVLEKTIAAEFTLGTLFAIMHALESKVIKTRSLLCSLNTIKYDFDVCGLNRENFSQGWELVNSISQLRQTWFELSEEKRIYEFIDALSKSPEVLAGFIAFIDENMNTHKVVTLGNSINQLKFGINKYLVRSKDRECEFAIKKRYATLLFEKLPYSRHTYDASWVLSDYIVKIPSHLFSIISGDVDDDLKPIFEFRNNLIKRYLRLYKRINGFGILLPTLRTPLPILNLKWRGLIALRRLLTE